MTNSWLTKGAGILAVMAMAMLGGTASAWADSDGNKNAKSQCDKHHDGSRHHGHGKYDGHGKHHGKDMHGARSEERFSLLDADGSGSISLEEFEAAGRAPFVEADADGDGSISREEMRSYLMGMQAERMEKMLDRMISRWDEDGDGAVSAEEFGGKRNSMKQFERLDDDGDGSITMDEFTR